MTYQIRETVTFAGKMYNIVSTMDYFRTLFAHDHIEIEYYRAIMSTLVELRAGYPYEDGEFINDPDGGYATLDEFFKDWGAEVTGGMNNPIDLSVEEEKKEEVYEPRALFDLSVSDGDEIEDDLVSELTFFTEIEEIDIMNDDIGDFWPYDEVEIERFTWDQDKDHDSYAV